MDSEYGWKIINYNEDLFGDECLAKGPYNLSAKLEKTLDSGIGVPFKMFDDDNEWYFDGIIVGIYDGLEPLDDFGTPYAGATEIRFMKNNHWEAL
jgi:hypothetical protein